MADHCIRPRHDRNDRFAHAAHRCHPVLYLHHADSGSRDRSGSLDRRRQHRRQLDQLRLRQRINRPRTSCPRDGAICRCLGHSCPESSGGGGTGHHPGGCPRSRRTTPRRAPSSITRACRSRWMMRRSRWCVPWPRERWLFGLRRSLSPSRHRWRFSARVASSSSVAGGDEAGFSKREV